MQKQLNKNKNFPQFEGTLKLTRIKGSITTLIKQLFHKVGKEYKGQGMIGYGRVGVTTATIFLLIFWFSIEGLAFQMRKNFYFSSC